MSGEQSPGGSAQSAAGVSGGPTGRGREAALHAAYASPAPALLAATAGIVAMLLARTLFGILTPAELIGDRLVQHIPLGVFSALLTFFGPNSKHLFFAALVIGQGLATAVVAAAYWAARVAWTPQSHAGEEAAGPSTDRAMPGLLDGMALPVLLWLVSAGIAAPLAGGGPFGGQLLGGAWGLLGAEVVPTVVTSLTFILLMRRAALHQPARDEPASSPGRRRALQQIGIAVVALATTAAAWRFIASGLAGLGLSRTGSGSAGLHLGNVPARITPPPVPNYGTLVPVHGQTPEITPAGGFYYVSKNLAGDPSLASASWRLTIGGMVDHPMTVTYDQLRAMPSVVQPQTLECISNEVGGNLMSNALWTGVRLADLLSRVGVHPDAQELIFQCADGYSDSIGLGQALDPRSLLVYEIDGQPLPQPHGFPARLLIPGLYGMKNGKWVQSLQAGPGGYTGYWEQQGWSRQAIVKTTARIDVPADGDLLPARPSIIAGVAFAGDRGIAEVDVSTDGGQTWSAATLERPPARQTWVRWQAPWSPGSGMHVIVVRAIDLSGDVQSPAYAPTLPDGASGYHAISVVVG